MNEIENYLRSSVEARKRFKMEIPPGLAYYCLEDFVLQNGQGFTEWCPRTYTQGTPQRCFDNAYVVAARSNGRLTYCEGYAMSHIIPVHHAWACDPEGRIVDTTWKWLHDREGWGLSPEGYYGVLFDIDTVRASRRRGSSSLIDDWRNHWPLLQKQAA